MPDEKKEPKPFSGGILNQITGRPAETIQKGLDHEALRVRPRPQAPTPGRVLEKKD